jgi:hypothetical protein
MNNFNYHIVMFIIMFLVGILFNPMNVLAYRLSDIYISITLIYGGLLMASNMVWSHQIVHYLTMGHFSLNIFIVGIMMSLFCVFLLRHQVFIDDKNWLKRMIGHHSTAITTTKQLLDNRKYKENDIIFRLAKDIVVNQEYEIASMKNFI